jgi:hypothetical protein
MFTESDIPTALKGTMIASIRPAIRTKSTFSGLGVEKIICYYS